MYIYMCIFPDSLYLDSKITALTVFTRQNLLHTHFKKKQHNVTDCDTLHQIAAHTATHIQHSHYPVTTKTLATKISLQRTTATHCTTHLPRTLQHIYRAHLTGLQRRHCRQKNYFPLLFSHRIRSRYPFPPHNQWTWCSPEVSLIFFYFFLASTSTANMILSRGVCVCVHFFFQIQ